MKKPAILIAVPQAIEKGMEPYMCLLRNTDTGMLCIGQPNQQEENNWEVVTLSFVNENNKVLAEPQHIPLDIPIFNEILQRRGHCFLEWEQNQCDGCRAGIPFMEGTSIHKKPNDRTDLFGIGCTAHLYDRPKLENGKITLYL